MLVHHLCDRIAQKQYILVERLDMALQLDAVDQIDRDRDMLLTQEI